MAESVGFQIERMIPELEQIKRLNLFTPEEVTEIIRRRKEFESKIERVMKDKDDFVTYIKYEVKLLRAIKLRRDKLRVFDKKDDIEYTVSKRIIKLYKMALLYFTADHKLWLSYINFCTQTKFMNAVSEAFRHMLQVCQVHGEKIQLWQHAAKWEMEERKNIEGAMSILKLGLHRHKNSKELYSDLFNLQLKLGSDMDASSEEDKLKQKKCLDKAEIMFKSSVDSIGNDVDYIISLLDLASKYDYAKRIQKHIIDYLIEKCWKSELMWHTMALRELQGKHYDDNKENHSRIQLCLTVYKSAIKVVPTKLMWEKYLETLMDLYNKKRNLKDTLEQVLQEAYQAGFLQDKHYTIWIELHEEPEKQMDILAMATTALPHSVNLWNARILLYIQQNDEDRIYSVSREAINVLKENSLPIYKLLIQYSTLIKVNNFAEIKSFFEEGIIKEPEISMELKPMFLEWLVLAKGIKAARQEYEKMTHYTPHCLELHRKMIFLELQKPGTVSNTFIRTVHRTACQQFGKNRTDVWLDFIKFEMSWKPTAVSEIYSMAKSTLSDNLIDTFQSEYALLTVQ